MKDKEMYYGRELFDAVGKFIPSDVMRMEHRPGNGLNMIGIRKENFEIKLVELGMNAPIKHEDLKKVCEIAVQKLNDAIANPPEKK